jgi:hypothetical protein
MSVCEVFEIIRSGGYFILYIFFPESPEPTVMEKKSRTHPILKSPPSVTMDSDFIPFWDKFVKHLSLQFQQLH